MSKNKGGSTYSLPWCEFLFVQLEGVLSEVKQLLPEGPTSKHRRADSMSNGSTTSSRSNPLRDDRLLARSNTQKARSQLLETHLAKLFKQKMEIFTKVDATQVKPGQLYG